MDVAVDAVASANAGGEPGVTWLRQREELSATMAHHQAAWQRRVGGPVPGALLARMAQKAG